MRGTTPVTSLVSTGRVVAAMAVVCACAAGVQAQTPRVEGPFAGLFGGQPRDRQVTQSLNLRGSLFGIYQDVLKPSVESLRELDPRFEKSGTFGGASGSIDYQYQRSARRAGFFVGGNASAADYTVQPETVMASYSGTAGVNAELSRRVSFATSGFAWYSPFYNFSPAAVARPAADTPFLVSGSLPSANSLVGNAGIDATLPGSNFGMNALYEPTVGFGGTANLNANLTSRTALQFTGDYRDIGLTGSNGLGYVTWTGRGILRHNLTRKVALRVGYNREESIYNADDLQTTRFSRDGIEAGVDYGDALTLPLGRRTTLSIAPAASMIRVDDETHLRLNGNARLTHNWRRTWSAALGYGRELGYVIGIDQPVLTDTASGEFGGLLSRRVRWSTTASWSRGTIGFESGGSHMSWYSASSGLSIAMSRNVAAYTHYTYYGYDVPGTATSLPLLTGFARQSVTAGLTLFAPVFSTQGVRR